MARCVHRSFLIEKDLTSMQGRMDGLQSGGFMAANADLTMFTRLHMKMLEQMQQQAEELRAQNEALRAQQQASQKHFRYLYFVCVVLCLGSDWHQ